MSTKCSTYIQYGRSRPVLSVLNISRYLETGESIVHVLGTVLLLRHDAVLSISAYGSAAFIESCAAIGWNSCDSVRSL